MKHLKKRKAKTKPRVLYRTIKNGSVKVTSPKQIALLQARKLPHTEVRMSKYGNIYRKRIYA